MNDVRTEQVSDLTTGHVRLAEAPRWVMQYPTCSTCLCDLDIESGDGWTCPTCGTFWDMGATDGDEGTLYVEWSGEEPTGPAVTADEASDVAHYREQLARHERWPDLVRKPVPPFIRGGGDRG